MICAQELGSISCVLSDLEKVIVMVVMVWLLRAMNKFLLF